MRDLRPTFSGWDTSEGRIARSYDAYRNLRTGQRILVCDFYVKTGRVGIV